MKPEIAVIARVPQSLLDALDAAFTVHHEWRDGALPADAAARVRGIVTSGTNGISAAGMERFPKAEIISCFGVGVDAIDLDAARSRGIAVTNTPDVLTDDVADLALALLLAAVRRIPEGDRFVRSGRWREGNMGLTGSVGGKVCGILGMGRIGQAIARRAEAFGMEIVYGGPRPKPDLPYAYHASARDLAAASRFLVVACPGGAATRHLVDAAVIDALGPEGILVNIARGSIVDEQALIDALTAGRLGAAALDVFEDEPNVPTALATLDNVVLSPHQGSATHETRGAMGRLVFENIEAHFAGRKPPTRVV